MLTQRERQAILDKAFNNEIVKVAGIIGGTMNAIGGTIEQASSRLWRGALGHVRNPNGPGWLSRGSAKDALKTMNPDNAKKLQRSLDAARFQQVVGLGAGGYLGYRGVKAGRQRYAEKMQDQYGTY